MKVPVAIAPASAWMTEYTPGGRVQFGIVVAGMGGGAFELIRPAIN
jgi:hypothetical protein